MSSDLIVASSLIERLFSPPPSNTVGYWLPAGYDEHRLMRESFFRDTLPSIASCGILSKEVGESQGDVPSGVIWIPYTIHTIKCVFKYKDCLEKRYSISYVGKAILLIENAMFEATNTTSSDDMISLGKQKDDGTRCECSNVSSASWAKQKVSADDGIDANAFEEYVKKIKSDTLMIKMELL